MAKQKGFDPISVGVKIFGVSVYIIKDRAGPGYFPNLTHEFFFFFHYFSCLKYFL